MPEFVILQRRADHADAYSYRTEASDIDLAIIQAIVDCPDDEYICGVWQLDTPTGMIAWHADQQSARPGAHVRRVQAPSGWEK